MKNIIQQGDILFFPYKGEIKGEKVEHKGEFAIAWGETSTHSHRISVKNPEKMEIRKLSDGRYIIQLFEEAVLRHEDHDKSNTVPQILPIGIYIQDKEREVDHFSGIVRKVQD